MKQVLYFTGTWCQPCKSFRPIMESLRSEMSITFIDIDASPQTTTTWNIRSIPTVIVIKDGMEIGRAVGVKTKDEIRALYNR
jgi:thioredoxin 1